MLLAGFTLVPVSPIPKICTKVRVRPMTRPPKEPCPAFSEVTPSMVSTKIKVSTISTTRPATGLPFTPASPLAPKPPVMSSTVPDANMTARRIVPINAPMTCDTM